MQEEEDQWQRGETSAKPRDQVFLTSSVWKLKMYADTTSRPGTLVWETTPRNGNKKWEKKNFGDRGYTDESQDENI